MFVLCLRHLFGELHNVCSLCDGIPHVLAELLVTCVHFIGRQRVGSNNKRGMGKSPTELLVRPDPCETSSPFKEELGSLDRCRTECRVEIKLLASDELRLKIGSCSS